MIIKLINDSARFDELISTLLIFDTYLRIHEFDSWSFIVNQRVIAIRKIMNEIQKIQIERQINDALNTRNEFIMNLVHDLSLNPDVLMWRKKNSRHDHWMKSYKLLNINEEICKVNLSNHSMKFRSTIVKSYRINPENAQKNAQKISFLTRENSSKSIRYVFFDVSISSVSHSIIELFEKTWIRQFLFFEAKLARASSCFTIKQSLFSKQNKFTIRANRFQVEISFLIDSTSSFQNSPPSSNDKRQTHKSIKSSSNQTIQSSYRQTFPYKY